jgi:hypothetical protein
MKTNFYKTFYVNSNNNRKKSAIFAPGLDRFILTDTTDYSVLFQIAEILSSKIPTLVYLLPENDKGINDSNCINYTIFNKTQQRIVGSPIVAGRQSPIGRYLYNDNEIIEVGIPEDYKTNRDALDKLIEYAYFVKMHTYAINLTENFFDVFNTTRFASRYIDSSWLNEISTTTDFSNLKNGIFFELRKILYMSISVEEAESKIINLWKNNYADQDHLVRAYYKILNVDIPPELSEISPNGLLDFSGKIKNLQIGLF